MNWIKIPPGPSPAGKQMRITVTCHVSTLRGPFAGFSLAKGGLGEAWWYPSPAVSEHPAQFDPAEQPPEGGGPSHSQGHAPWHGIRPADASDTAYGDLGQPQGPPAYGPVGPGYGGYGSVPWQPGAPPPPPMRGRRGYPLLAWAIIFLITIALVLFNNVLSESAASHTATSSANSIEMVMTRLQAQYMVGASSIAGQDRTLLDQAEEMLNVGTIEQRLSFVALSHELGGPEESARHMSELQDLILEFQPAMTEELRELMRIFSRIYSPGASLMPGDEVATAPAAGVELSQAEQDFLVDQFGWLGELAITHAQPDMQVLRDDVMNKARFVAFVFIAVVVMFGMIGFAGFIGLMVMFVLVLAGRITMRFRNAIPDGGIYAETFAVWIVLFVALQIAGSLVPLALSMLHVAGPAWAADVLPAEISPLWVALVAFALSLVAVMWPMIRGIPFRELRRDIGWTSGQGVFAEIGAGLASYAMTLPLLGVGVVLTLALMALVEAMSPPAVGGSPFGPTGMPAHPIVELVSGPDWVQRVLLLLVAAVAAPIVEETMFRGVLYRAMRNSSRGIVRAVSVILSIGVVSFIFAAVHPQGWFAIPALGSLAAGMALAREWRDSIIAPMVLHATSNGIIMTLLMVIAAP
jgi:membrane protease YdiL (CAAX protease family)